MSFTSREHASAAGRLGGWKTKQKLRDDPNYFSRIGRKGGQAMLDKLRADGRDPKAYYSTIGKLPKKAAQP